MSSETVVTIARSLPTRRQVNADPHPDLTEAVTVSRFWRMVAAGGPTDCWRWLGDVDGCGYGVFTYRGIRRAAHELALSFSVGERRAEGMDTCHSCDNPPCCNPAHLRFDTRRSNVADMVARGRNRNGSSRLTADDVRAIRTRRALGARQKDLAEQFGVSDGQISMIVRGVRWKSAGGPIRSEKEYHRGE